MARLETIKLKYQQWPSTACRITKSLNKKNQTKNSLFCQRYDCVYLIKYTEYFLAKRQRTSFCFHPFELFKL